VATAFWGAPRGGLAQLCARLGEPAAGELVAEVHKLSSSGPLPNDEVKAAQRALFRLGLDGRNSEGRALEARAAGEADAGRTLFLRIGCGWLAPAAAFGGGDRLQRLAQQLPRDVGQLLLDEASTPASEAERQAVLLLASARPRAL
jgi:hypothetical protein